MSDIAPCRKLLTALLSLFLTLALFLPLQAQTSAPPEYTAEPLSAPRELDPPYQGEVTLGGGGGKDIAGGFIDALLPFWRWENSLLFINPRFNFGKTWNTFDDDQGDMQSGSLGLGYRLHLPDPGLILGANVYYDHLWSAHNNKFEQIGAGIEVMHQWFDFRFNYYWPLNDEERYDTLHTQQVTSWTEDWSRQWRSSSSQYDGVVAQGHHVYQRTNWSWADNRQDWRSTFTQTFSQTFDLYEVALEGFDVEVGLHVPLPETWGELRVFGGYMYFDSDYTDKYDGFTARLEYRPVRAIALDAQWLEEDQFLGSNWTAGVRLILPFDMGALAEGKNPFHNIGEWFSPGSRSLDQRLTELVKRDSYTHNAGEARERVQERSLTTTKEDTLLAQYVTARGSGTDLNPLLGPDGQPLFFYFVDPARSTGSDGSYEDPFATHLDGLNALGSSGFSYEGLSLAAGQSYVDAAGVTHVINLDNTPLNGVLITGNWRATAQEYFTGSAPADSPRASWTTGQLKITGSTTDQPVLVSDIDFTGNTTALAATEGLLHIDLADGNIDVWRSSITGSAGGGVFALLQGDGFITVDNIALAGNNTTEDGVFALIMGNGGIAANHIQGHGDRQGGTMAQILGNGEVKLTNISIELGDSVVGAVAGSGNITMDNLIVTGGSNSTGVTAAIGQDGNVALSNIAVSRHDVDGVSVEITGNGNLLLNNIMATDNRNGISAQVNNDGDITITNVTAADNRDHGITANVHNDGNVIMTNLTSTRDALGGIYAGVGHDGNINMTGLKATDSGRGGIYGRIGHDGDITAVNLEAANNGNGGFYAQVAGRGNITMNNLTASGNAHEGIEAIVTANGVISLVNVQATDNQMHGIVARLGDQGVLNLTQVTAANNGLDTSGAVVYGGLFVQSVSDLYQMTVNLLGQNNLTTNQNFDLGFSTGAFVVNKTASDSTGLLFLTDDSVNIAAVQVTLSPVSQAYYNALNAAGFDSLTPASYDGGPVAVRVNTAGKDVTLGVAWD